MPTNSTVAAAVRAGETRRIVLQAHLWLALTLGMLGTLIGVTGSVLVYHQELDAWLHPHRYAVSGAQASLPNADYAAAAERAVGGRGARVRLPEKAGLPVTAIVRGEGAFHRVYLDPPTARVLDAARNGGWTGWVHRFHENLILREYKGREVVGAVGAAMLVSSLTGLYLWWPGRARWRAALGPRPALTTARNLHYLAGFYGSLAVAMLSFTGIWLAFPDLFGRSPPVRALHAGEALAALKPLYFAAGLLPAVLATSGLLLWLSGRLRRSNSAPRRAAAP